MRRLVAGIVVIAVIGVVGVVITMHSSSAAGPRRTQSGVARVVVTPRLKRLLQAEISTLRAAQPRARVVGPSRRGFSAPDRGVPCFIAVAGRCSEVPCREFASGAAVYKPPSTEIVVPGALRRKGSGGGGGGGGAGAPACTRRAPRKLVLVSGP